MSPAMAAAAAIAGCLVDVRSYALTHSLGEFYAASV